MGGAWTSLSVMWNRSTPRLMQAPTGPRAHVQSLASQPVNDFPQDDYHHDGDSQHDEFGHLDFRVEARS